MCYGLSNNLSSDFRDLDEQLQRAEMRCCTTVDVFCYRVAKYVGSYVAAMNGVDAIAFTAGLGEERMSAVREAEVMVIPWIPGSCNRQRS